MRRDEFDANYRNNITRVRALLRERASARRHKFFAAGTAQGADRNAAPISSGRSFLRELQAVTSSLNDLDSIGSTLVMEFARELVTSDFCDARLLVC